MYVIFVEKRMTDLLLIHNISELLKNRFEVGT